MHQIEAGSVLESIDVDDASAVAGEFDVDEIGFSFGGLIKSIGKAASAVVKSPALAGAVGVLAVAFPAVGIPAAAAVAVANKALKVAEQGVDAANQINDRLKTLKTKAAAGDKKAATAVNAMQVALAAKKAKKLGLQRLRPVAVPGKGSFSTTPIPLHEIRARQQPTSLYKRTAAPSALAQKLAAGGSPLGRKLLAAVRAGKSVAVPSGVAVVPGKPPQRYARMWIGKPPKGTKGARELRGAHAVTKGGYVVTGQAVFVA